MNELLKQKAISSIPKLTSTLRKGDQGRICIIGGCEEYSGAPFFAAMACLHMGADLVHIVCDIDAAPIIKSYSPEIMVHPYLRTQSSQQIRPFDRDTMVLRVTRLLDVCHCMVIGPGMGRDPIMLEWVSHLIELIKQRNLPIVIDADGLYLISQHPSLIESYDKTIMTPNHKEFNRLCESFKLSSFCTSTCAQHLAQRVNGHVLLKGPTDILASSRQVYDGTSGSGCSLKRCGGQGDILSGVLACLVGWSSITFPESTDYMPQMYAASCITRHAAKLAYDQHLRSTLAMHVLGQVPNAFNEMGYNVIHSP